MNQLQKAQRLNPWQARLAQVRDMARRIPGADVAFEAYENLEYVALSELRNRMARLDRGGAQPLRNDTTASLSHRIHPRELLTALLDDAAEQTPDDAQRSLYTSILLELTPDEACLLAALSDGHRFPLINLSIGTKLSGYRPLAGNFSSIQKFASVKLRDYVPAYIDHLLALGVAETFPEDKAQDTQYQILEGDPRVRAIITGLGPQQKNVRFDRRTLGISDLGRDLWRYCHPIPSDD